VLYKVYSNFGDEDDYSARDFDSSEDDWKLYTEVLTSLEPSNWIWRGGLGGGVATFANLSLIPGMESILIGVTGPSLGMDGGVKDEGREWGVMEGEFPPRGFPCLLVGIGGGKSS